MRQVRLLSIQVGLPEVLSSPPTTGPDDTSWCSAFGKRPVAGRVWVGGTNVVGDRQASSKTHGGPEKAVCVYPWEHYCYWERELNLTELTYGAFAENFTLVGQQEDQSCIGDSFRFGDAVIQITQPRPPCWRLARWWQRKEFAALMEATGKTGWYCRVLLDGYVEAGTTIQLLDRPYPEWTVSTANRLLYSDEGCVDKMWALSSCTLLSESWRESLLKKRSKLIEAESSQTLSLESPSPSR